MSRRSASEKLSSRAAATYLRDKGLPVEPTTLKQWRWQKKGPAYYSELRRIYYRPRDLDAFVAASVRRIDPHCSKRPDRQLTRPAHA